MNPEPRAHHLYLFRPPYRLLVPLAGAESLGRVHDPDGTAVVWCMGSEPDADLTRALRLRPGGIPLLAILPRSEEVVRPQDLFSLVDQCRPHSLLPYHPLPNPQDLRTLLAAVPSDLPAATVEYLAWRGLVLDTDLRRTVRRVLELSSEVRTVTGLSRGLYMSRRALGRRFLKEGLPVPSHWLHFGRLLRVVLDLQRPETTLMDVAFDNGYPDGFSLSNQMKRLTGLRPSQLSGRLGWEWIAERWIQTELHERGFGPEHARLLKRHREASTPPTPRDLDERQPA